MVFGCSPLIEPFEIAIQRSEKSLFVVNFVVKFISSELWSYLCYESDGREIKGREIHLMRLDDSLGCQVRQV